MFSFLNFLSPVFNLQSYLINPAEESFLGKV